MKGLNSLPIYGEKQEIDGAAPRSDAGKGKSFSTLSKSAIESGSEPSQSSFSLTKHDRTKIERKTKRPDTLSDHPELKKLSAKQVLPSARYPFHRISPAVSNTLPNKDIVIKGAPNPEKPPKMNWLSVLAAPVGMVIIMLVMVLISGKAAMSSFIYMIPMSLIGVVVAVFNYRGQKKEISKTSEEKSEKYTAYLDEVEKELADMVKKQQEVLNAANPSAYDCASMNEHSAELWNRGSNSKQFMSVRLGVGHAPLCVKAIAPEKSYDREVPLEDRARAIAENSSKVANIPITFDLKAYPSMGIVGDRENVISQAKAFIVNATAMHSYEDLKLVVAYPKEEQAIWEDIRWLPHMYDDKRQIRYIACTTADCKILLNELTKTIEDRANSSFKSPWANTKAAPHYLVVITDMSCIRGSAISHFLTLNDPALAISSVFLASDSSMLPQNCQGIVETTGNSAVVYLASAYDRRVDYIPDHLDENKFSEYCHTMAPIRIDGAKSAKEVPTFFSFLDAWQVQAPEELPIAKNWSANLPSRSMEVPLGAAADGEIFRFDDHCNVHGVHGMYVGTTGSGKTSMVRSWILSMATSFSPRFVNFVLIDFKGSGLIDGLEKLPHVIGTISNLDNDIRRNLIALESEIERRETYIRETGGTIYTCYEKGNFIFPFLFIVIDELAEFKIWSNAGDDNRMQLLTRISQVGNSLGIQLLAGSQTTAPFTDTMEKNSKFRWCLKTATPEDSMYLLKTDDAFNITEKGRAIVRVGSNEVYEEIQPAFSDGAYYTPDELRGIPERDMALLNLQGFQTRVEIEYISGKHTQLDAVVAQINKVASELKVKHPRKIWPDRLPLVAYWRDLERPTPGELKVAIGIVDDPKGQQQYTLQIDLQKNGHVVLYGAPRTGKTTFLMTAAISMLTHCNPEQVEMYMIGSSFKPLWNCPQVAKGVDTFAPKPVISMVYSELIRRKKCGLSSADKPIILFIDSIGEMMFDFKTELTNIAQFGAGCRVYLLASAGKQADVSAIAPYLTRGYALWFSDSKYDYQTALTEKKVDRIPSKEIPGRGIFYDGRTMEFQTAIPYETNEELSKIVQQIFEDNKGFKKRTAIRKKQNGDVVIGIGQENNWEVIHNFREQPSLLVLGKNSQKRDSCMQFITQQLAEQPDVFQMVGVDLDYSRYTSITSMIHLQSGQELDTYLDEMFDEVKRRNELQKNGKNVQFPKYIFVINDWEKCVSRITELSHKRLTINILQKGKLLGIQLVTANSYQNFANRFENDEIGATQLLGVGCAALIGYTGQPVPSCFAIQMKQVDSPGGDYYVTSDNAERINISI